MELQGRKKKKALRSATRRLEDSHLISLGEVILDRIDRGETLNDMEKYTLKFLQKEFKTRNKQMKGEMK